MHGSTLAVLGWAALPSSECGALVTLVALRSELATRQSLILAC